MHPILAEFGPITIYAYGVLVAIGFAVGTWLAVRAASNAGLSPDTTMDVCLAGLVAGLIGGRLLYVALNWPVFAARPWGVLMFWRGGLIAYGGLIAGFLGGIWILKRRRAPILRSLDLLVPYVALAHAFGRVGCFLNGCCYGAATSSIFGLRFPHRPDALLYPTQLHAAAGLLTLCLALLLLGRRRPRPGTILLVYLAGYAGLRFFQEFMRGDNPPVLFSLTRPQLMSIALLVVVLSMAWGRRIRSRRA